MNEWSEVMCTAGSFIVNTARGGIVDEVALQHHLSTNHIGGAGLDVVEHEPISASHPLHAFPNVILTPHVAWFSVQSLLEMRQTAAHVVTRSLTGAPLRYIVN